MHDPTTPAADPTPRKKFNLINYYKMPVIPSLKFAKDFWSNAFGTLPRGEIKTAVTYVFLAYVGVIFVKNFMVSQGFMAVASAVLFPLMFLASIIIWALYLYFLSKVIFHKPNTYENILAMTFYIQLISIPISIVALLLPYLGSIIALGGGFIAMYMWWMAKRYYLKFSVFQVILAYLIPVILFTGIMLFAGVMFYKKMSADGGVDMQKFLHEFKLQLERSQSSGITPGEPEPDSSSKKDYN